MPVPKRKSPIPDHNVLDLRRMWEEADEEPKRHWPHLGQWLARGPRRRYHQPSIAKHDWVRWRREVGKFFIPWLGLLIVVSAMFGVRQFHQFLQSVERPAASGFQALRAGGTALSQFHDEEARQAFTFASERFSSAAEILQRPWLHWIARWPRLPLIGAPYRSATAALRAGQSLAAAGSTLSDLLKNAPAGQPAVTVESSGYMHGSIGVLTSLLQKPDQFQSGVGHLVAAASAAEEIRPQDVPGAYRDELVMFQRLSSAVIGSHQRLSDMVQLLSGIFFAATPKEYLVVFQNNDELRATGGFPGTFLLVQFDRGTFKVLDAPGTGPYSLSDQIPKNMRPPQPILAVGSSWAFQDTTWFLDVPTSASFMLNFYEQARGFEPDGVIFLTPQIVETLLKITGPIGMPNYGVSVTADNFVAATEDQVEFHYDKAVNKPKQFLLDMMPALIGELSHLGGQQGFQAAASVIEQADEANLLFYSRDQKTEQAASSLAWAGDIGKPMGDFLAVTDSNLGGGKTDRVIQETISTNINLQPATIEHTVTIIRHHQGDPNNTLQNFTNRDFIRVYAPANATLTDISGESVPPDGFFFAPAPGTATPATLTAAEGQELLDPNRGIRVTHESGKTVFGAWSILPLGQQQTITFRYTTPRNPDIKSASYTLDWQKQPGAPTRTWTLAVTPPTGNSFATVEPASLAQAKGSTLTFKTDSQFSQTFGFVLKK
ncbi:MAG: DUF4012 domain-containing protein [Candidatus Kerfeldbacteria bacterium]|nr:DUF4012 domain-containing protein [Candidatus Kerfeldbacteria bacterium]